MTDPTQAMQIFHSIFLVNDKGEHPEPYTLISSKDMEQGLWQFNPELSSSLNIDETYGKEYVRHYTRQLKDGGKYDLTIWPYHVQIGSLGNALDIYSFKFAPLKRDEKLPEGLPKRYRRAFNVNLLKHWDDTSTTGAPRAKFLRELTQNLIDRPDIFNVMLGPAYPGHKNHFHFDCANYRLISI